MKNIFKVDLCYYTEENLPECGAIVFVRSEQDLTTISETSLKENIFIKEEMEKNDCEGIGYICDITEEEFNEFYSDYELIEFDI